MAIRAIAHRSLFLPILAALVALAWVVLWLWGRSPFAIFLDHSQMRALCLSGGPFGVLNLYVLGWMLMTAAMMLPTTFPLLEMFRRLTQQCWRRLTGSIRSVAMPGRSASVSLPSQDCSSSPPSNTAASRNAARR
jgi:predicted metal-binding membrane protein